MYALLTREWLILFLLRSICCAAFFCRANSTVCYLFRTGSIFPIERKLRIGLHQICSPMGLYAKPICYMRSSIVISFLASKHNGLFILCSKHSKQHIINFISFAGKRNTKLISESEILNY